MGAGKAGNFGNTQGSRSEYEPDKYGYYGRPNDKGKWDVRHMDGDKTIAKNFFDKITSGYTKEETIGKGKGILRTMPDGAKILYRPVSVSDGTPAVDIKGGNFKTHKIHFVK